MVDMLIASLPSAVCVLLGMILIIVEVFLPGFGLPGIGGIFDLIDSPAFTVSFAVAVLGIL